MALIRQPHVVTVITPDVDRDADNNAAHLDYNGVGASSRSVRGTFQTRPGDTLIDDSGKMHRFDAMLYTLDKVMKINDVVTVSLPGLSDKFIVKNVEPKFAIDGRYTHTQCILERELRGVKS